jgi:hypothetical protein
MRTTTRNRIDRFVDWFIGDYMNQHGLSFGANNDDWMRDAERMQRCEDAAAYGGDGSTHREVINDWREAFRHFIRYGGKRNAFSAGYARFEAAVEAHFTATEEWHIANGSIDEEIG